MSRSLRTALGKVRGLGAAREGAQHFMLQRATAIALAVLVPWFLVSLLLAVRGGYGAAIAWIGSPLNAVGILLALFAALSHMRVGMQVIVEDYIAKPGTKVALLILNTFLCVALFAAAAYAVVRVAIRIEG